MKPVFRKGWELMLSRAGMRHNEGVEPRILTYLPLVSPVATLVVVVLGVFFSNRHVDVRISDLRAYIDARFMDVDHRFDSIGHRFDSMDRVNDTRTQMILGKIEDIEAWLSR